ncbi:hypothetical protein FRC03_004462 [Tulasnella sp. 419]|nr:hypothetical protein FRC03_004462 [Tulasnella sp. 419]
MQEYPFSFPKPPTTESLLPQTSQKYASDVSPLGIDGLLPHPSLKPWTSLVSSTPPPCIDGLQRHPDSPEPFYRSISSAKYSESSSGSASLFSGSIRSHSRSDCNTQSGATSRQTSLDNGSVSPHEASQKYDDSFLDMYWDDEDVLEVSRSTVSYSNIPESLNHRPESPQPNSTLASPLTTSSKLSSTSSESSDDSAGLSDAGSSFFHRFFPMFTVPRSSSPPPKHEASPEDTSNSSVLPRLTSSKLTNFGNTLSDFRSYIVGLSRHPSVIPS